MASLICFFYLYSVVSKEVVPMCIRIDSDIPIGAGLGSSAALSVCLATGLLSIARPETFNLCEATKDEISRLAFLSEKILHGTPSGVDNSVSSYGGMIEFANGVVTLLESVPRLRILLVNTNVSRNTKHVIEKVRDQFIAMPRVVKAVMDAIDGVSHTALANLKAMAEEGDTKERYETAEKLLDYNQKLLEALNVSHPALEEICSLVAEYDLHAKLTGAGGGGFAFVLLPPYCAEKAVSEVKVKLAEKGFDCRETSLGVSGVQISHLNHDPNCATS